MKVPSTKGWNVAASCRYPAATEALRTGIGHFVDCIESGATPITDGRVGLGIVELLETATRSIRQGGRPIDLAPTRLAS